MVVSVAPNPRPYVGGIYNISGKIPREWVPIIYLGSTGSSQNECDSKNDVAVFR